MRELGILQRPEGLKGDDSTCESVFFSHDGGQDDLFALAMLCQAHKQGKIRLEGVAVTGGNCYVEAGVRCSQKILDLARLDDQVEVSICDQTGVNAFPPSWRKGAFSMCHLPVLLRDGEPRTRISRHPAHIALANCLRSPGPRVTVLETGVSQCVHSVHALQQTHATVPAHLFLTDRTQRDQSE